MAEKDWITRYFAPLATPGARHMRDDAGLLQPSKDWQIVTTDALVEGVHFLSQQDTASIARKLVRVNVSDILAKGARPVEALLTLGWPMERPTEALSSFAESFRMSSHIGVLGSAGRYGQFSSVLCIANVDRRAR